MDKSASRSGRIKVSHLFHHTGDFTRVFFFFFSLQKARVPFDPSPMNSKNKFEPLTKEAKQSKISTPIDNDTRKIIPAGNNASPKFQPVVRIECENYTTPISLGKRSFKGERTSVTISELNVDHSLSVDGKCSTPSSVNDEPNNVYVMDVDAKDDDASNVNANDVKDIDADDVNAKDQDVNAKDGDVLNNANAKEVNAKQVDAKNVDTKDDNAKQVNAKNVDAKDVNAKQVDAKDVSVLETNILDNLSEILKQPKENEYIVPKSNETSTNAAPLEKKIQEKNTEKKLLDKCVICAKNAMSGTIIICRDCPTRGKFQNI